uniref:Uncharacterized protein n=1 Tax=Rousettus aegyptiacus TaxID=9407 RepID=A0A7J8H1Y4_ROUAE|nr:hypothetical protein HJG63_011188 [Rousettus aegyptiacus]
MGGACIPVQGKTTGEGLVPAVPIDVMTQLPAHRKCLSAMFCFVLFCFFCWPLGKRDVSTGTSTSQTRKSHTGPFVFTGSPRFSAAFARSVLHPDSPDVSARTASGFCGLQLLAAAPAAVLGGLRPGSRRLCRQAQRADGAGRQNPPGPALERPRRGGKSSAALPGVSRDKHRGFT